MSVDYRTKITELENKLSQNSTFDYDAEKDELFQLTRQQLERQQQSGVNDTLARYAANTGMGGSSEAMAAAQQTASQYNSMIAEALTEAEEKAYNRWNTERTNMQSELANLRSEAITDAQSKAALGDLSGYKALGYDTTAYEQQLAAEKEQSERAARQEALSLALQIAQTTGDLSELKALGYDTTAYEQQIAAEKAAAAREAEQEAIMLALQIAKATGDTSGLAKYGINVQSSSSSGRSKTGSTATEIGANGMTKAEYESTKEQLYKLFDTYNSVSNGNLDFQNELLKINAAIAELDREYYQGMSMNGYDVEGLLERMLEVTGMGEIYPLNYTQYKALAEYFADEGGEEYLKKNGITYQTKSYIPSLPKKDTEIIRGENSTETEKQTTNSILKTTATSILKALFK